MAKQHKFVFVLLFALLFSLVFAQAAINRTLGSSVDVENVKETLNLFIDKKITAVENFRINKVANASIDQEDKDLINGMLDDIVARLNSNKELISAATTLTDIQVARQTIVQDMIASKDDIRAAFNALKTALNDEAVAKLQKTVDAVNVKIDEVQKNCPQQKNQIDILQAQFNQLVLDTQQLNQMYQARQDPTIVSMKALQVSDDLTGVVYDLEQIIGVCVYYNSGYQAPANNTSA